MKILAIGDVFGKPGRAAIKELLPKIIAREGIDFVIVNIENAAGGRGVTPKTVDELCKSPIDVMTAGNHVWEYDVIHKYLDTHKIIRPLNTVKQFPGKGCDIYDVLGLRVAVVSLQGEIFMEEKGPKVSSPFKAMETLITNIAPKSDIIIVDFHAEATSEKRALAWFLDGRVTAVLGTHTHVQTADEEILPQGTAYISDLGMTGPHLSIIGLDKDIGLHRFLTGEKKKFKVGEKGVRLEGVIIDVDERAKKAVSIKRVKEIL